MNRSVLLYLGVGWWWGEGASGREDGSEVNNLLDALEDWPWKFHGRREKSLKEILAGGRRLEQR